MTDAVEKVSAKKLWNSNLKRWNPANRFLNQDCAFVLGLESMLLRNSPQNPFSTASVISDREVEAAPSRMSASPQKRPSPIKM
jgi:hypothetical protein